MQIKKIISILLLIVIFFLPLNVFAEDISQDNTSMFNDISNYDWAKNAINYFGRANIISGDGKGNFFPGKNVTREEFAAMLSRALNIDTRGSTQTFIDVSTTRWSYNYIESVKEYLTGYYPPKGKPFFDPDGDATREDVAVALAKMIGLTEKDLKSPNILEKSFIDAEDVSYNLRGLMAVVVEKKIMIGYDKKLRPTEPITRAEVTTLLFKVLKGSVSDANKTVNPPELIITQCPDYSASKTITISGTVKDSNDASPGLYINDARVNSDSYGFWAKSFTLKEGKNTFIIKAINSKGKSTQITKEVVYTVGAPELIITQCPETSTSKAITISGTVKDSNDASPDVYINNSSVYSNSYGLWSKSFTLKEGKNTFVIKATNSKGKSTQIIKEVVFTVGAPELIITQCPETSTSKTITISGTVKDSNNASLGIYINNVRVYSDFYGSWSKSFTLTEGKNTFIIKAINNSGKTTQITKEVVFTVGAPELIITQCPETSTSKTITISGTVKDSIDASPGVYINNVRVYSDFYGLWSKSFTLKEGKNTFIIKAINSKGKTTQITKEVTFNAAAPEIIFTNCPEVISSESITLSGKIKDSNDSNAKLYINDQEVSLNYYNEFNKKVSLLDGDNTFVFRSVNSYGKSKSIIKVIKRSNIVAPTLNVDVIPESTTGESITISGTVADSLDPSAEVYVNDNLISSTNGVWNTTIKLASGDNNIIIVATNKFGKSITIIKKIKYEPVTQTQTPVQP